jgi:hypothetical protein
MKRKTKPKRQAGDRLTISLGKGQRDLLEAIADKNHASLAYILRYALERFAVDNKDKQLPLEFPPEHRT